MRTYSEFYVSRSGRVGMGASLFGLAEAMDMTVMDVERIVEHHGRQLKPFFDFCIKGNSIIAVRPSLKVLHIRTCYHMPSDEQVKVLNDTVSEYKYDMVEYTLHIDNLRVSQVITPVETMYNIFKGREYGCMLLEENKYATV